MYYCLRLNNELIKLYIVNTCSGNYVIFKTIRNTTENVKSRHRVMQFVVPVPLVGP